MNFEKSEWINKILKNQRFLGHRKFIEFSSESAQEFVENADFYILERKRLLKIMKSLFKHFISTNIKNKEIKVLDLGCGDGILSHELLKTGKNLHVTLVDGSSEMLENARKRLVSYPDQDYIQNTFQELIENDLMKFDFIVSSLAMHHLSLDQKKSLYKYIHNHLNYNGFFLNIDVVRAPSPDLEEWYLALWKEWIAENEIENEISKSFVHVPEKYKNNPDNHPDTLKEQLDSLLSVGYKNVDCYYKYGIFSVFGGQK